MALISVIIPCYNVEKLIDRLFYTIENQTMGFDKLELIFVDDCSTDGTVVKLEQFEAKHPDNVLVVKCDENGRQGKARNIGLSYASAEHIGFLDSDDWIELNYFEKLYAIANGSEYDIVACDNGRDPSKDIKFFDNIKSKRGSVEYDFSSDKARKELIMFPTLGYEAWAKIFKKSFLVENRLFFPENITYEDSGWGSLIHLCVNKAFFLGEKLYHYYVNERSTVLTTNSNHHLDLFTVQMSVWDQYISRGFLEKYRYELEIEHIFSFYLAGIKAIVLRYETPDYNAYLLLRYLMLSHVPNYEENPYVTSDRFSDYYLMILTSLKTELSKRQFFEMAENIKKIGI